MGNNLNIAASKTSIVTEILAEAARRGISLRVTAGNLQFRPRTAMTSKLTERIRAHRFELLSVLTDSGADNTRPANSVTVQKQVPAADSSVLLAPESGTRESGLWTQDELDILDQAGVKPGDLPLVSVVKKTFADSLGGVAKVVSVEEAYDRGGLTRRRAGELIRSARKYSVGKAVALRDVWFERLAICIIDGGLTICEAQRIALSELEMNA